MRTPCSQPYSISGIYLRLNSTLFVATMKYPPHQLPSVLLTTLLLSLCCCGQTPPNQFHGRAQPSSLDSFFERALGLVNEVNRLLSTAENDEDVVEYCVARLENLLTNCVNLFRIIEEQQYNCIIDTVQTFLFMLRSRIPGLEGRTNSAYSAPAHGFAVGRPPYDITFDQLSFLVGENFNTRRIANCLGVSVSTLRRRLRDNNISLDRRLLCHF